MARIIPGKIDTLLALRSNGRLLIGRERITLLEAVIEHGSITKAAEIAGFSYKTAWDAVNAINNLLPRPAFITHTGGPRGGGAEATEEGRRLIHAFRLLEEKLGKITNAIVEDGLPNDEDLLFWGLAMKLSVSNAFHSKIVEIMRNSISAEILLSIGQNCEIMSDMSIATANELLLTVGKSAVALINSASITLFRGDDVPKNSASNKVAGNVMSWTEGENDTEIMVDIGDTKTLLAKIPKEAARELRLEPGSKVWATFSASQVILACD